MVFTRRKRDTKMEVNYRHILEKQNVEIRRVLDPDQVLPYVRQESVMSGEDIEKIRAKNTRFKKVDVFMEVLERGSHDAFDVFVKALEKVHPHLACLLLRSEIDLKSDEMAVCKYELSVSKAFTTKRESECEGIREELKIAKQQKKDAEREHKEELEALKKQLEEKKNEMLQNDIFDKREEKPAPSPKNLKEATNQISKLTKENRKLLKDLEKEAKKEQLRKDLEEETNKLSEKNKKLKEKCTRLQEMGATSRSIPTARVFSYKSDFNEKGIHAQGTNAQASSAQERVNIGGKKDRLPGIIGTQCQPSTSKGKAKQPPNNEKGGLSSTEEQRRSWWCVDLGEKYSLFLTHFTLRHARDSCPYNWDLEGSRDGENWKPVLNSQRNHESDDTHSPCMTETWSIKGEVEAYRFFRIPQMGENSSGLRFDICFSGMELYGVLLDMSR